MPSPSPRTRSNAAPGSFLLVGGGLLMLIGVVFASVGLFVGFTDSMLSGHSPGALPLIQGLVLAFVGWRIVHRGKQLQCEKLASTDKEADE